MFVLLCLVGLLPAALLQETPTVKEQIAISFSDKTLRCSVSEIYREAYSCYMSMYINNKYVTHTRSLDLQHQYKSLLRATVRCDATCDLNQFMTATLQSEDLVINTEVFIGLCCAGAVVFLIIVALIIFGVCRRRRRYKPIPKDAEKPLAPKAEKQAEDEYSLPDKSQTDTNAPKPHMTSDI